MVSNSKIYEVASNLNDFCLKQEEINLSCKSVEVNDDRLPTIFYFNSGDSCESSYECCRMC